METLYTLAFIAPLALVAALSVRSMSRYLASRGGDVLVSIDDRDEGRARVVAGVAPSRGQRGDARPLLRSTISAKGGRPQRETLRKL